MNKILFFSVVLFPFFLTFHAAKNLITPLIVGGEPVAKEYYRFVVAIQKNNTIIRCAGVLIREDIVLTLASCIDEFEWDAPGTKYWVLAGTHDLYNDTGSQTIIVDEYIPHPEYVPHQEAKNVNNICLLKLRTGVVLLDTVEILKLPDGIQNGIMNVSSGEVAGWGFNFIAETNFPPLQKVSVSLLDESTCEGIFPRYNSSLKFCAGGENKGPCFFDEGGPFFTGENRDQFYGIYEEGSAGKWTGDNRPCAQDGKFRGLHIKIAPFLPWIMEEMRNIPAPTVPTTTETEETEITTQSDVDTSSTTASTTPSTTMTTSTTKPAHSLKAGTRPIVFVILTLSIATCLINCGVLFIVIFQWIQIKQISKSLPLNNKCKTKRNRENLKQNLL